MQLAASVTVRLRVSIITVLLWYLCRATIQTLMMNAIPGLMGVGMQPVSPNPITGIRIVEANQTMTGTGVDTPASPRSRILKVIVGGSAHVIPAML